MDCKYDDICENYENCNGCNGMDKFKLDESQFKCYDCEASKESNGASKCPYAFDLYSLGNKCSIIDGNKKF